MAVADWAGLIPSCCWDPVRAGAVAAAVDRGAVAGEPVVVEAGFQAAEGGRRVPEGDGIWKTGILITGNLGLLDLTVASIGSPG